ncbi:hypothetical protein N7456_005496 [Penicillium angulare]|uniref:MYND-type domain-containing protein n=1 Tax=Penicillium angulare TaxID=116970 RepID=A0A9W9FYG5_9EURO|nr:hypothetical protein N7456_005496 [Penicillium angulare]
MSSTVLPSGCGICGKQKDLLRCEQCKVMPYCGPNHQSDHLQAHKSACNDIKECREVMEAEEIVLNDHLNTGFVMTAYPFDNSNTHPLPLYSFYDYMSACFTLIKATKRVRNHESTEAQLSYLMYMLGLCRSDVRGIRILVPPLMLSLNKDQDCYDFIKWWNSDYYKQDQEGTILPYVDITGDDPFEPVDFLEQHAVCLTLLKVKMFLDLQCVEESFFVLRPRLPREIVDQIHRSVPQSLIIRECRQIVRADREGCLELLLKLEEQIQQMHRMVSKRNQWFWNMLAHPVNWLDEAPDEYAIGSVEEAALTLCASYDAWRDTPNALDFINAITDTHPLLKDIRDVGPNSST